MTADQSNKRFSRRGFLIALTGSAAAAGYQATVAQTPSPASASSIPAVVPNAQWGTLTYDQPILTPTDRLFTPRFASVPTPHLDSATWQLSIDGLVENPITLSLADLHALPSLSDTRVVECLSNPAGGSSIGNVSVKGADFASIISRLGIQSTATHVKFEAADGYTTAIPLARIMQHGVLLAYELNGLPLIAEHGYPLRIFIPGLYVQKQPQWLTRITFLDHDYRGYWEQRGLSNVAEVRTKAIIHTPITNSEIAMGGSIVLQGVAVAGTREITRVELQIDDGDWFPAEIASAESPYAWRQWYVRWIAPAPGVYRIGVRATDGSGFTQHEEADRRLSATPNGTSAIHRIAVYVV